MLARFLVVASLFVVSATAQAYGDFPPYTSPDPSFGIWLVLAVLAFYVAAHRLRFDVEEDIDPCA